jgi:hypothetical protein
VAESQAALERLQGATAIGENDVRVRIGLPRARGE